MSADGTSCRLPRHRAGLKSVNEVLEGLADTGGVVGLRRLLLSELARQSVGSSMKGACLVAGCASGYHLNCARTFDVLVSGSPAQPDIVAFMRVLREPFWVEHVHLTRFRVRSESPDR